MSCLLTPLLFSRPKEAEKAYTPPATLTGNLMKKKLKPGDFLPGYGVEVVLPDWGMTAKFDTVDVWLFDLDGDGVVGTPDADGFSLGGCNFVVAMPAALHVPSGLYDLTVENEKLQGAARALAVSRDVYKGAAYVQRLRVHSGLPTLIVNETACRHCEQHADYLQKNGLAGGSGGMSAHDEDPSRPGYTEDGARAGKGSNLHFGQSDLCHAMDSWYASVWHRMPIIRAGSGEFGMCLRHGVAMYYAYGNSGGGDGVILTPADGAIGVRAAFSDEGELPNPVPGSANGQGMGFPLTIQFPWGQAGQVLHEKVKVTAMDARSGKEIAIAGFASSPQKPANKREWPSNSGMAAFVPSKPLPRKTLIRVEFVCDVGGESKTFSWSFTTQ